MELIRRGGWAGVLLGLTGCFNLFASEGTSLIEGVPAQPGPVGGYAPSSVMPSIESLLSFSSYLFANSTAGTFQLRGRCDPSVPIRVEVDSFSAIATPCECDASGRFTVSVSLQAAPYETRSVAFRDAHDDREKVHQLSVRHCPEVYVLVEPVQSSLTKPFCVMKYEAKFASDGSALVASRPDSTPIRNITSHNAAASCQSLGADLGPASAHADLRPD